MSNNKLNKKDAELLAYLDGAVSHYDTGNLKGEGIFHADDPNLAPTEKLSLAKVPGNPTFGATISMQILLRYFSVAAGAYTARTPAEILAADGGVMATKLPAFVFGQIDYEGGFSYAQSQFPLTTWDYDVTPFVYGKDYPTTIYGELDATAKAALQLGDLVIPCYASPGATDYVCLVIIRVNGVAYGKLLNALGSNRFWINTIRYTVEDAAAGYAQYRNDLKILGQTMFGRFKGDTVPATMFKQPNQFQKNIVDIPVKKGFDKSAGMGMYVNYDSPDQTWDFFVATWTDLEA